MKTTAIQRGFRAMLAKLEVDGQLVINPSFYFQQFLRLSCLWLSAIIGIFFLEIFQESFTVVTQWSILLLSAVSLGLFWHQLAFVGHDAGHNTVHGTQVGDRPLGWLISALFGVSIQWWKSTHNVHHLVTNMLEDDPDVQHMPVMCLDPRALDGYYSTYAERQFQLDSLGRFFIPFQHWLFYPIMAVARVNLYAQSIIHVCGKWKHRVPYRFVEFMSLLLFWTWHMTLLFAVYHASGRISRWFSTLTFFFVSHAVAGLTHVSITLSHFPRPLVSGENNVGVTHDAQCWIENAAHSSLDISCSPQWDWFHGGLQFQVAHHLLPRVPRHRLRYVNDHYVVPFLKSYGLPYHTSSFVEANLAVLSVLRDTAQTVQKKNN